MITNIKYRTNGLRFFFVFNPKMNNKNIINPIKIIINERVLLPNLKNKNIAPPIIANPFNPKSELKITKHTKKKNRKICPI